MKTTLESIKVGNITADSLVHTIKDVLLRMKVKLSEQRDQCYDGASNMSGSRNGVATQIIAEEKCAVYTHCCGHALNIAVGHAITQSKICRDASETAFEISKLIKFSPKRNVAFDHIRADIPAFLKKRLTQWSVSGHFALPGGLCAVVWIAAYLTTCTAPALGRMP